MVTGSLIADNAGSFASNAKVHLGMGRGRQRLEDLIGSGGDLRMQLGEV